MAVVLVSSMLSYVLPFAFASGINLYATVAVIGLCARYRLFALPSQFAGFDSWWVIGLALALYAVEFVADKVPWVDTLWDAVHTAIRPVGGAVVAMAAVSGASPEVHAVAALLGGTVAMTTHLTKAGTRAAVNTSPEPFTNWALSLVEDLFVVGLTWTAVQHPVAASIVTVVLLVTIGLMASVLVRLVRRRFARAKP
mgnify:CR=1 FL=1